MQPELRRAIHQAIIRLAEGDRSVMPALVKELWPVLLDFARRALPQAQDAEDVAQEVFLKLCARIADFDAQRDGVSWAFGIASYEVLTLRRKTLRRREAFAEAELAQRADSRPSQEEEALRVELEEALTHALGQISEADRVSLGWCLADPVPAIGAAARKRRQRALERLRTLWRSLYGEP
jgi:RNA polymerase sigma-70 factor (ECF subfamily)